MRKMKLFIFLAIKKITLRDIFSCLHFLLKMMIVVQVKYYHFFNKFFDYFFDHFFNKFFDYFFYHFCKFFFQALFQSFFNLFFINSNGEFQSLHHSIFSSSLFISLPFLYSHTDIFFPVCQSSSFFSSLHILLLLFFVTYVQSPGFPMKRVGILVPWI